MSLTNTTFEVELGGLVQGISYDFLRVNADSGSDGDLDISSSQFDINLTNSFTPGIGDSFTIVTWDGALTGVFSNANNLYFDDLWYALNVFGDSFVLTRVSAVPVPLPFGYSVLVWQVCRRQPQKTTNGKLSLVGCHPHLRKGRGRGIKKGRWFFQTTGPFL